MKKYLAIIACLGITEVGLVVYLSFWRKIFWNYVAAKDLPNFLLYLGIFTLAAVSLCIIVATANYFITKTAILWRKKLNSKAHILKHSEIENINQRIQEDCSKYPDLALTVMVGISKAFLYIIVFTGLLTYEFNYVYTIIIFIYGIIATVIARVIGGPLLGLNYKLQQSEATYRNKLTAHTFKNCLTAQLNVAKCIRKLQYFQSLYGQLGVVIPLLIIAPAYFSSDMLIGSLMQASYIMGVILDYLSYGINNFDMMNKLLTSRKRLKEIKII